MLDQEENAACRAGNVFSVTCPARYVLDVLADKWALLLIHTLTRGTCRTAELRRQVGGISEKMLIQTLRRLERFGLVNRVAYPQVPPRVEYSLTPLGLSLSEPIRALDHWVERNIDALNQAQAAYAEKTVEAAT